MPLLNPLESKAKNEFKKSQNIPEETTIYSMGDLAMDLTFKKKSLIKYIKKNEDKFINKYNLMSYKEDYYLYEKDYLTLFNDLEKDINVLSGKSNIEINILEHFTATQLAKRYDIDKFVVGNIAKILGLKDSDEYCIKRMEKSNYAGVYEKIYYTKKAIEVLDEKLLDITDEDREMLSQMYGRG